MHFYFQTRNFYPYFYPQELLQSQPWGLFFTLTSYNSISLTSLLKSKTLPAHRPEHFRKRLVICRLTFYIYGCYPLTGSSHGVAIFGKTETTNVGAPSSESTLFTAKNIFKSVLEFFQEEVWSRGRLLRWISSDYMPFSVALLAKFCIHTSLGTTGPSS